MKKMILATLLLCSTVFGQDPPLPICKDGKVWYQNAVHAMVDLCKYGYRGVDIHDCMLKQHEMVKEKGEEATVEFEMNFFKKRQEEVCGK